MSDAPSDILIEPWHSLSDASSAQIDRLIAELKKEISPKHPLFGLEVRPIARRYDRDDVLFQLLPKNNFAVVHLTGSGRQETSLKWPTTKFFDSLESFLESRMKTDSTDYNN